VLLAAEIATQAAVDADAELAQVRAQHFGLALADPQRWSTGVRLRRVGERVKRRFRDLRADRFGGKIERSI
jgi:hypothetical protein